MLEEYRPTITYIKGPNTDTAYSLIGFPLINSYIAAIDISRDTLSENYFFGENYSNMFPLTYLMIDKYQNKDKELVAKLKRAKYHTKSFWGWKFTQLICRSEHFYVNSSLILFSKMVPYIPNAYRNIFYWGHYQSTLILA